MIDKSKPYLDSDLKQALSCLKKGGIILYPTDTVWGIGCDARNAEAIKRIFDLKKRADSKSMIVLVNNLVALERLVGEIPEVTEQLLESSMTPLTIIYDEASGVSYELLASDGSLGIRITTESFSNNLCRLLGAPLVSTSANISGEPSPGNFSEISEEIKKGVDYIVEYKRDDKSVKSPSHIIKLSNNGEFKIIR